MIVFLWPRLFHNIFIKRIIVTKLLFNSLYCGKSRWTASCKTKNQRPEGVRAPAKMKWRRMTGKEAFCCLSFHVSRRRKNYFLPPSSPAPPLSSFSDLSLPLLHFLPLNPANLAVLAFRRSPSRIPPPFRRRCSCPPASAVLEAAAGAEGVEPAASAGWVCRMVIAS